MAKFRKPVLAVGRYRTRGGDWLDATEARLQGWSDKFRAMRKDGIKLPLAWGHQPLAEPIDPFADPNDPVAKARREFSSSAYCAGQLDDIEYNPADQTLYATGSAPGADIDADGNLLAWVKMPDGTQLRSAVNEVSIGINNWVDGKGGYHEDVPVHLALCVRPVAHGLGGFLALSTELPKNPCKPGHQLHCDGSGCECRPVPLLAFSTFSGPIYLAAEHAPKGGISIAGKQFRGGQFIPASVMAQASPEEKAKLEATKQAGAAKLKASVGEQGPDAEALRAKLHQYSNLELKGHQVSEAKRLYNGIKSYHGELSLHRIHQLIHEDEKKLETAKPADKQRLYRRLKGYHHMLDWHEQGQDKAAKEEKASRTGVQNVPFEKLHVDPERFQYKLNTGKTGVVREGSALEGVKRFRPEFAGAILVWHDPADKKTYVVNGHHRHDLAKKAGQQNMAVLYMEAKDAKEARKVGALANIAEGRGTAVDAAKLIRDEQFKPEDFQAEGVSLKGPQAKNAFVLAKLSDSLFKKLVQGSLDEKSALAIAGIESHEHQQQFADWLAKQDKDIPDRVLQRMAQKIQNTSGVKTTTSGLFGEEENDENLFLHRATLETHALAKLSAEANLFGAVSSDKKAAALQSKGGDNQLDVEKNKEVADEARQHRAVLAKLVDRKGPISDAFNQAAEELYREPRKRKQIEERLLGTVRGLVQQEVGGQKAPEGSGAAPAGAGGVREGTGPSPAEQRTERVKPEFMPSAARKTLKEMSASPFDEGKHPRGQPENAGEFVAKGENSGMKKGKPQKAKGDESVSATAEELNALSKESRPGRSDGGRSVIKGKTVDRTAAGYTVWKETKPSGTPSGPLEFPDAATAADFLDGKILGLHFLPPTPTKKTVPITEDAAYQGQDEPWTERKTGEEVLKQPMIGWHYSSSKVKAFKAKTTCFFPKFMHEHVRNGYMIVVPAGTRVEHYGDEFRVDLHPEMKIYQLKGGWNPHKPRPADGNSGFVGHTRQMVDGEVTKQLLKAIE